MPVNKVKQRPRLGASVSLVLPCSLFNLVGSSYRKISKRCAISELNYAFGFVGFVLHKNSRMPERKTNDGMEN